MSSCRPQHSSDALSTIPFACGPEAEEDLDWLLQSAEADTSAEQPLSSSLSVSESQPALAAEEMDRSRCSSSTEPLAWSSITFTGDCHEELILHSEPSLMPADFPMPTADEGPHADAHASSSTAVRPAAIRGKAARASQPKAQGQEPVAMQQLQQIPFMGDASDDSELDWLQSEPLQAAQDESSVRPHSLPAGSTMFSNAAYMAEEEAQAAVLHSHVAAEGSEFANWPIPFMGGSTEEPELPCMPEHSSERTGLNSTAAVPAVHLQPVPFMGVSTEELDLPLMPELSSVSTNETAMQRR